VSSLKSETNFGTKFSKPPWAVRSSLLWATLPSMTDERLIAEAGQRLAAATERARVILFGSYARGEAGPESDLDLLVIEPEVSSPRAESARLRRELRDLDVALDVIVVSARQVDELGNISGTMVNEALQTGRVLVGT
jgi:predicted nucleotidyltransferase